MLCQAVKSVRLSVWLGPRRVCYCVGMRCKRRFILQLEEPWGSRCRGGSQPLRASGHFPAPQHNLLRRALCFATQRNKAVSLSRRQAPPLPHPLQQSSPASPVTLPCPLPPPPPIPPLPHSEHPSLNDLQTLEEPHNLLHVLPHADRTA